MTRVNHVQRVHRRRFGRAGQALVEFAILLPTLVIVTLGGVALNSSIDGQSLLQQAVNHAALVGARDAFDPCLPGDAVGDTGTWPSFQQRGWLDVYSGFADVLNASTLFTGQVPAWESPSWAEPAPAPALKVDIYCSNTITSPPVQTWNPATINAWSAANAGGACYQAGQPYDKGCHKMWAGGIITVTTTVNLKLSWSPLTQFVKLTATAAEQIEPFRQHTCAASVAVC